ncbi:hypothetical protein BCR34DRAFT_588359 [Clohesyomyces aquaticus]|uniref:AA1-like domain-containing protein n=1 Tax=Clohesyomyces aquaticus TaxID=1231657 RepID=A0A1Y1ZLB5_9PLEO|nr:hypothetical protein BCR34DRAFT_588359 [Clohesyomyces aquaticus]
MFPKLLAVCTTLLAVTIAIPFPTPTDSSALVNATTGSLEMSRGVCGSHVISRDLCAGNKVICEVSIRSFVNPEGGKSTHPWMGFQLGEDTWFTDTGSLTATRVGERINCLWKRDMHSVASSWNSNGIEGISGYCYLGDWTSDVIESCDAGRMPRDFTFGVGPPNWMSSLLAAAAFIAAAFAVPTQHHSTVKHNLNGVAFNATTGYSKWDSGDCWAHIVQKEACAVTNPENFDTWSYVAITSFTDGAGNHISYDRDFQEKESVMMPSEGHPDGAMSVEAQDEDILFTYSGLYTPYTWTSNDEYQVADTLGACITGDWTTGPFDGCPASNRMPLMHQISQFSFESNKFGRYRADTSCGKELPNRPGTYLKLRAPVHSQQFNYTDDFSLDLQCATAFVPASSSIELPLFRP